MSSTTADGTRYVPCEERTGAESAVYFTRDLSPEGLIAIFRKVKAPITGKVAVKLHTGEPHGPNIIPREWVKKLIAERLPGAAIVETNTFYKGDRYTTKESERLVRLPMYYGLTMDQVDYICDKVKEFF